MTLRGKIALDERPSGYFICNLPANVRAEIDDILRDGRGVTKAAVIRVLKQDGYEVTRNRLNYHYQEGHHLLASVPEEGKADTARRARMH
jgi:hypothetical protein